jgi:hypothetical protein
VTKPTRTTNRLPFTELDARRFEDLCLAILYKTRPWAELRHYGRLGADQGVDIFGRETLDNGLSRIWSVQCRRYEKAPAATLRRAVDDTIARAGTIPDVLLVIVACDVSRSAFDAFRQHAAGVGVGEPLLWTASMLEATLYADRHDLLFTFFGVSLAERSRTRESAVRRNLGLKKRMIADFRTKSSRHSKLVIRSIDDVSYPEVDNGPGISSWFVVEMHGFYHNGVEVYVAVRSGIIDSDGKWAILNYGDTYDATKYEPIQVIALGRIPFRNIVEYDMEGDDYYSEPHIYCTFADAGEPYEGIVYRRGVGHQDWPLDVRGQFTYRA